MNQVAGSSQAASVAMRTMSSTSLGTNKALGSFGDALEKTSTGLFNIAQDYLPGFRMGLAGAGAAIVALFSALGDVLNILKTTAANQLYGFTSTVVSQSIRFGVSVEEMSKAIQGNKRQFAMLGKSKFFDMLGKVPKA